MCEDDDQAHLSTLSCASQTDADRIPDIDLDALPGKTTNDDTEERTRSSAEAHQLIAIFIKWVDPRDAAAARVRLALQRRRMEVSAARPQAPHKPGVQLLARSTSSWSRAMTFFWIFASQVVSLAVTGIGMVYLEKVAARS